VRLLGEEDPTDPQSLAAQKAWKRIIVLAAGSSMNIITPIVLFAIAFMLPQRRARGPGRDRKGRDWLARRRGGPQAEDRIVSLDGSEVKNTLDVAGSSA
jgi:membrane-associated protease RseP (regulator of RpoE activity)